MKISLEVIFLLIYLQNVTPFRSLTRSSSTRKYSSSMPYISQTPIHSINPMSSLPTTPLKTETETDERRVATATSDYISEVSSNGDKPGNAITITSFVKGALTSLLGPPPPTTHACITPYYYTDYYFIIIIVSS